MNDTLTLFLAGFAGLFLGGVFFGGLWWTVRQGITAKQPGLWFLGSLLVRMSIVLTGFYYVGGGDWQRLLICLVGFIGARWVVVWLTRPQKPEAFADLPQRVSVGSCERPATIGANALRLRERGTVERVAVERVAVERCRESGHAT